MNEFYKEDYDYNSSWLHNPPPPPPKKKQQKKTNKIHSYSFEFYH